MPAKELLATNIVRRRGRLETFLRRRFTWELLKIKAEILVGTETARRESHTASLALIKKIPVN